MNSFRQPPPPPPQQQQQSTTTNFAASAVSSADKNYQSLHSKCADVCTSLLVMRDRKHYTWPEILEQYSVLTRQYHRICEETAQLRDKVLTPDNIYAELAAVLPDLLGTKLLPEQEKEQLIALVESAKMFATNTNDDDNNRDDDDDDDDSITPLTNRIQNHNEAININSKVFFY